MTMHLFGSPIFGSVRSFAVKPTRTARLLHVNSEITFSFVVCGAKSLNHPLNASEQLIFLVPSL